MEVQVPSILNGTRAQIHAFRGLVEPFLVLPLPVVLRRFRLAAAVQGDVQGAPTSRFAAEDFPPDGHLVPADLEGMTLVGIRQGRMDGIPPLALEGAQVGGVTRNPATGPRGCSGRGCNHHRPARSPGFHSVRRHGTAPGPATCTGGQKEVYVSSFSCFRSANVRFFPVLLNEKLKEMTFF